MPSANWTLTVLKVNTSHPLFGSLASNSLQGYLRNLAGISFVLCSPLTNMTVVSPAFVTWWQEGREEGKTGISAECRNGAPCLYFHLDLLILVTNKDMFLHS